MRPDSKDITSETIRNYEMKYALHPWSSQKKVDQFIVSRAKGCYVWDDAGKKYMDFSSQVTNVNAGHQHPKILAAIKKQVDKLCYIGPSVLNDQRALLAKTLADLAPGDLSKAFIVTGGSIAIEFALKIARAYTGRQKIISRFRSYHGGTYGASSVTGDPRRRAVEPGVPGSIRVWDPHCYRCFFKMTFPECGLYCADAIREVIENEGPETVAAIIVEPITGSACRIVPPDGYLQKLREICDDYGILLIFDEIMTAFGRSGEWFAANHWNVVPDIMALSKGMNSGYLPLGATMVTKTIGDYFEDNILYVGSSQYGNPVGCASALATIDVYREEKMIENSKRLGDVSLQKLEEIGRRHRCFGQARGKGLMLAIELVKDKNTREPLVPWTVEYYEHKHPITAQLLARLKEKGLLTYMRWNVLFVCPPLCITEKELLWGLEQIDEALEIVDDQLGKS